MRLIAIALLLFATSCKKSSGYNEPEPCNAIVMWYGAPALDGLGWVLKVESLKIEKPANLATEFQVQGVKVNVKYEPSTETFPCFCAQGFLPMVRGISISKS